MLPIDHTEPEAGIYVPLMFLDNYIGRKGIWLLHELPFGTQQFVPLMSWVLKGSQIPLWPIQLSINIKGTSLPDSGTVLYVNKDSEFLKTTSMAQKLCPFYWCWSVAAGKRLKTLTNSVQLKGLKSLTTIIYLLWPWMFLFWLNF